MKKAEPITVASSKKSMARRIKWRIRRKLEAIVDSDRVTEPVADRLAGQIQRLDARTDWTIVGRQDLEAEIRSGQPVIMALWHGRLAAAPLGWNPDWGPFCVVTSSARPGMMVGRVMQRFGLETLPMRRKKSNAGTSLQIARMARQGTSIGFAVDGPSGPPGVAKSVPIDWARLTGLPVWLYTNSYENYRRLPFWDSMAVAKPGTRGCMIYRRWDATVPKRLDEETREALRARLQADLAALTLEADRMMGHDALIN